MTDKYVRVVSSFDTVVLKGAALIVLFLLTLVVFRRRLRATLFTLEQLSPPLMVGSLLATSMRLTHQLCLPLTRTHTDHGRL